jgi:hypothetical protein
VGAVINVVNETSKVPSSAEEGWREAPGWCWSRNLDGSGPAPPRLRGFW